MDKDTGSMDKGKSKIEKKIGNKIPMFIIDSSSLQKMFEGSKEGLFLLEEIKNVWEKHNLSFGFTTMGAVLGAIYRGDAKKMDLNVIKDVIGMFDIAPSLCDFKDEKKLVDETIHFANIMAGEMNDKSGKNREKDKGVKKGEKSNEKKSKGKTVEKGYC